MAVTAIDLFLLRQKFIGNNSIFSYVEILTDPLWLLSFYSCPNIRDSTPSFDPSSFHNLRQVPRLSDIGWHVQDHSLFSYLSVINLCERPSWSTTDCLPILKPTKKNIQQYSFGNHGSTYYTVRLSNLTKYCQTAGSIANFCHYSTFIRERESIHGTYSRWPHVYIWI